MNTPPPPPFAPPPAPPAGPVNDTRGCRRALWICLGLLLLVIGGGWWFLRRNFNAKAFTPVVLTPPEQQVLTLKTEVVETLGEGKKPAILPPVEPAAATPAPAATDPADARLLVLTEREVNSLASSRPEFNEFKGNVRVDFEPGAISLDVLIPVEAGVPLMGGKNLRVAAKAKGGYRDGQLSFTVTSARVGGIEVPQAWIGDFKGKDLGAEWMAKASPQEKTFLNGIESIEVKDDRIELRLKE